MCVCVCVEIAVELHDETMRPARINAAARDDTRYRRAVAYRSWSQGIPAPAPVAFPTIMATLRLLPSTLSSTPGVL